MKDLFTTTLGRFRLIAFLEGISSVLLFAVAMPMKYLFDIPAATSIVGRAHGFLFVVYMFALLSVWIVQRWSIGKVLLAFVASVIPPGTFLFEYMIRDERPRESRGEPQA